MPSNLRDQMLAVIADVNAQVAEREELVEMIAIALLTRKNLFLLGAPGQAKSYAINAFRSRIQCSRMANPSLSENPPQPGYHIMRCIALFLVYIDHSVHPLCYASSSCLSICKDRLLTTSWNVPDMVQPAAFLCPPPPKYEAIFATSTRSEERMLTL